ncbi:MAG: Bax inhibitor-1/YccA family protein [Proteobacteria bacterium]|nr:Bax inhibitor-1/YccA family protein [Pseudomonadota bacterium]
MALGPNEGFGTRRMTAQQAADAQIDVGLRSYMLNVYNLMASGVALTGIVAASVASSQTMTNLIFGTPLKWVIMLAPLALVFFVSARIHKMSAATAQMTFWVFAALMGASLASIFLVYTGTSIARVFFIAAGTFGAMSLYGYTTKKDLSGWGSFLFMGLIGVVIAMVVNIFLASSALMFVISVVGVLVFVGLTAYDTQKIRNQYYAGDHSEVQSKKAIMGALTLYLDFINLFIMMLHLFGSRE